MAAQTVTLSATVSSSTPVTEGSVTFTVLNGGSIVGTATGAQVLSGVSTVSYALPAGLPPGAYIIQAVYSPGPDYLASTDTSHCLVIQVPTESLGNVNLGSSSAPVTVVFSFTSATTLNGTTPYQALTGGAAGLDFSATGGSCTAGHTYNAGDTCTVTVVFTPRRPGGRAGAVVALNDAGKIVGASYLVGTGIGAQAAFNPGTLSTALPGVTSSSAHAVDGSGNLYVVDSANKRILKYAWTGSGYGSPVTIDGGIPSPTGVAVDGAGNVYYSAWGTHFDGYVAKVPWNGSTYGPRQIAIGGSNYLMMSVAVDGQGNVYAAEDNRRKILKASVTGSSWGPVQTVMPYLSTGQTLAVDAAGNVYLAEKGGTTLRRVPWDGAQYGTEQSVAVSGLNTQVAIAIDSVGNAYIGESGNNRIVKVPWTGSGFGAPSTVLAITGPAAVAMSPDGILYATDSGNGLIAKLDMATPSTVTFQTATAVGTLDTADGPQTVTVSNTGNGVLNLADGTNPAYPAAFPVNSAASNPCVSGGSVQPGASCDISANFQPSADGANLGTVTLADNSLGIAGVTQSIPFSGTGTAVSQISVSASVTAADKTYDGANTATITGCSLSGVVPGDVVTCQVAAATFATVTVGNEITVTATGITLHGASAGKYSLTSTSATTTANILAAAQGLLTVTGVPTTPQAYNTFFTVGAVGGSGTGAVTFAASGACSVTGTTVTMTSGTGTCSVTATKAADANYSATTSAPVPVLAALASQAALTVTGVPASAQPRGASFTVGAGGGSGAGAVTFAASGACSVSGTTVTMTGGTGTCSVTATKAGDTNYSAITSAPALVSVAASGVAAKLIFATEPPASGTAGAPFGAVVQVLDVYGNLVASSSVPVTITSTAAGIAGTTSVAASGGVATFTGLVLNTPGSYTLTASSPGLPSVTSTAVAQFGVVSYNVVFGNRIYNMAGTQRVRLPWRITAIQVVFSEPVTSGDVTSLTGLPVLGFSGLGTNTLTWTVASTSAPLPKGVYSTALAATGAHALRDSSGNAIAPFNLNLKLLMGDVNDDGVVNSQDLALVNTGRTGAYNILYDINGDGVVDANDVSLARTMNGSKLP
jgi:hypothetical protein